MNRILNLMLFALLATSSLPAFATTGIGSVAALWGYGLVVLVLVVIIVLLIRFLSRVRKQSMNQDRESE